MDDSTRAGGPEGIAVDDRPLPWLEMLELCFRRRWLLLSGVVVGLAAALWWISSTPPSYRATARILLGDRGISEPRRGTAIDASEILTEMALLKSTALVRKVLERQEGPTKQAEPEVSGFDRVVRRVKSYVPGLSTRSDDAPPPDPLDRRVNTIVNAIQVVPVRRSNVVEVSLNSTNPTWSARFINDLLEHHIDAVAHLDGQTGARDFFQRQASILEERWRRAREELDRFRASNEIDALGGDQAQLRTMLARLQSEVESAEAEATGLRARIDFITNELQQYPEAEEDSKPVGRNDSLRRLETRILDLKIRRSELLADYTTDNPIVIDLNRQIEEAERLLESESIDAPVETYIATDPRAEALRVDLVQGRSRLAAAQERVKALSARVTQYRTRLIELGTAGTELERLQNEEAIAEETYQDYLRREEKARFSSAMDESRLVNVTIVESAKVPTDPIAPHHERKLLIGLVLGLALGGGLALVRDYWDPSVKSGTQAARISGVRVIAETPRHPSARVS